MKRGTQCAVLCILLVAACSDRIRISGEDDPEAKLADIELELALGEDESRADYQFASILDVVVTDDDVLWVLDGDGYMPSAAETPMLRRYDRAGNYLGLVGRQGEGPGEYRAPYAITALPDGRVAMRDARLGDRVTLFTLDGGFDATWVLGRAQSWPFNGGAAVAADTNGIVWYPFRFIARPAVDSDRGFLRLRPDGSVLDTVPFPPSPEVERDEVRVVRTTAGGGQSVRGFLVPYQPRGAVAWSPHGHFAMAATNAYSITVLRPPAGGPYAQQDVEALLGSRDRTISRDLPPVEVPEAERTAARDRLIREVTEYGAAGEVDIPDMPTVKPPLRGLYYAADGRLWVWVSMPSRFVDDEWSEPDAYDVFEPDGRFVGRILVPDAFQIEFMKDDHMWGRYTGEFDVESVRRYRIVWR